MLRLLQQKLPHLAWVILIVMVLALTFTAYLRPAFILDLANRFVMC